MSLPKRARRTHSWREVLKGEYKPDAMDKARYHYDMRESARHIMEDLKLILEKASPSDLYQIFDEDEERWNEIMFPVASRLLDVVGPRLSSEMAAQWKQLEKRGWYPTTINVLFTLLKDYRIKVRLDLLFEDKPYPLPISQKTYGQYKMDQLKRKIKRSSRLTEQQKTLMIEQQVPGLWKALSAFAKSRTIREKIKQKREGMID